VPEKPKKKMPRVALLGSRHTMLEYHTFLGHLLVGFSDRSAPVTLVCPPGNAFNSLVLGSAEVITHPVFEVPLFDHLNRKLLIEKLEKFKPNILHCLCESMAALTRYLSQQLGVPYIISVNSLHKHLTRSYFSIEHCSGIMVPAGSIEANLVRLYPNLADKINLVNMGSFTEQTISCFSDTSRPATLIITYPFHKTGEFENLFGAIHHLMIDGYDLMVVVIGGGRAETELWKMLAALSLLQIVTIVPREIPRRPVLKAGDIFIQPRPVDFFDPMLLEAMSIGSAVAGCRGGVDDLIIENETAIVFNPADELNIMSTLQKLLDGRDFARKIGQNAQDYVKQRHSVSRMISSVLRLYQQIVS
jgi:glycosyltransferase involved in cell wall biosynthesis